MDKIQEIRKALEAATPGPWNVISSYYGVTRYDVISRDFEIRFYNKDNAHLIANAPEWLSYLLAELDTKDKQIERLKGLITFDTEYNELKINVEELIKERDMYADAMFSAVKELDTAKQENERLQNHIEKIERAGYV